MTRQERNLVAAILRTARTQGWESGHRLGWANRHRGVAVSVEPGLLNVWWRTANRRWPTSAASYPIASLDEAIHVLVGLRLLPGTFCLHGREVLADVARVCQLAADHLARTPGSATADEAQAAAGTWRELARQARRIDALLESL